MLARAHAGAVLGIDAYLVTVEVDVASGLPAIFTVGLPQGAVKEGRERVVAAVQNSGYLVPPKRITVNLAPAGQTNESTDCSGVSFFSSSLGLCAELWKTTPGTGCCIASP